MNNREVASQIQEDLEIFGPVWRSSFAFDVRRVMIERGLKNIDLAERLQVSEANISRMLRGDQNIKIETMYVLAAALGESLNICLGDRYRDKLKNATIVDDYDSGNEMVEFDSSVSAWRHSQARSANDHFYYSEMANEGVYALSR